MNGIGVHRKPLPRGNVMEKGSLEVDVKDRGGLPPVGWKREGIPNAGIT